MSVVFRVCLVLVISVVLWVMVGVFMLVRLF